MRIVDRGLSPYALKALVLAPFVLALALAVWGPASAEARPYGSQDTPTCSLSGSDVAFLRFSDALDKETFDDTSVGGLSALTYDRRRDVYYSLVDNGPESESPARFYTLRVPVDGSGLDEPEILDVTALRDASGEPFTASNFDGEGIELTRKGNLLVSSETEPSIRRFSHEGNLLDELPVPEKFRVAPEGGATSNQTFESLSLSRLGWSLFTATEGPLAADGQTAEGENRTRLLRYDGRGYRPFEPAEEFFYLTEPEQGVVETVTLSETELLVLERGFVAEEGNTVRIFKVSLKGEEDVSDEPSLAAPGVEPVEKELIVDLADCPPVDATTPGTQQNPLLDNYESLELGPRLPGGRRAILLQSDDNFNDVQVTRVISLAAELSRP